MLETQMKRRQVGVKVKKRIKKASREHFSVGLKNKNTHKGAKGGKV